ncbi:hypothetical protein PybrP1_010505, partial [[Pythium] brassicae (nom. inval.)]
MEQMSTILSILAPRAKEGRQAGQTDKVTMAANQSIKELMAAETKASKIISEARQERGERLKQAKVEAEAEINAFRKQQEHAFQMNGNTDLMGDDPSILDEETNRDIQKM